MFNTFYNTVLKRRSFLKVLAALLFSACKGISSSNNEKQSNSFESAIDLGELESFKNPYTAVSLYRIAILKTEAENGASQYRALSLVCTHQNCIIKKNDDSLGHVCPCHNSEFNEKGIPLKGPAVKPLNWKKLEIKNNRLFVFIDENVSPEWKLESSIA